MVLAGQPDIGGHVRTLSFFVRDHLTGHVRTGIYYLSGCPVVLVDFESGNTLRFRWQIGYKQRIADDGLGHHTTVAVVGRWSRSEKLERGRFSYPFAVQD